MDIKSLRLYLTVLEEGSITRAAERCHITQPALGLHIRKLEHEMGLQLLERHSRGISPTEAGRVFARHAQAIIEELELARAGMTRYARIPTGKITVGLTPSVREAIATPLLEKISREFDGILLTIKEVLSEALIEYLLESRVDIALVYNTREGGEQLTFTPLAVEKMYFVYPLAEGARPGTTIPAREVFDHRLILPTRPHHVRTEVDRIADKLGIEIDLGHEVDSVPAIRSFVAHGFGASVMPRPPAEAAHLGSQLVVEPEIRRLMHLAHARKRPMSRAFETVLDAVKEVVKDEGRRPDGQWQALETPHKPT